MELRYRELKGIWRIIEQTFLIMLVLSGILYVLDLHYYFGWTIYKEQYLGFFLALLFGCTFLTVPPSRGSSRTNLPFYDIALAFLGLFIGLYVAIIYPQIVNEMGRITTLQLSVGIMALAFVLEGVRRLTGWMLVILALMFIFYALFARYFPGILFTNSIRWDRLINYCSLDSSALLGLPLTTAATIALPFIFFGNILFATGGGKFLTDFAMATLGRFRGGPAKVAVVASSLFGTLSGVAVANVYVTGVVTIPMMVRMGYQPHMAAAVEAVASTGGILMPPVMGIVAFLMSEFLGLPYSQIAIAAVIPALIYYAAVLIQVDLEAAKSNLKGLPLSELPRLQDSMKGCLLFIVPLVVLVYTLFKLNYQPAKAAMAGVLSVLVLTALRRRTRVGFRQLLEVLEKTGRSVLDIGMLTAIAGIIIGIIFMTGIGFRLSMALVNLSGGNPLFILPVAAIACIILGMGMPPAVVYIILAVLVAPAITQLGIPRVSAHMFLLYFSTMSMITPPVCLCSFAAANIASADPLKTGFTSVRLGMAAYILPFIFVFSPALLWDGTPLDIAMTAVITMVGTLFIAVAFAGFFMQRISFLTRIYVIAAAIGLILPAEKLGAFSVPISWVAGAMLAIFVFLQWRSRRKNSLHFS